MTKHTEGASGTNADGTTKTLYYLSDALGSVIGLEGQDGSLSARYRYDEFGVAENPEKFDLNWSGPDNLFGYTSLGYDYYSGYSHAQARDFDSSVGRFISEDMYEGEIENPLSLNLYTYVENNPLRYTDPTGYKALPKAVEEIIRDFKVIEGGAVKGAKKGSKTGLISTVITVFMSSLFAAAPVGEDQESINTTVAKSLDIPILSLKEAEDIKKNTSKSIVYRSLSAYDVGNLVAGRGILSKHTPPPRMDIT